MKRLKLIVGGLLRVLRCDQQFVDFKVNHCVIFLLPLNVKVVFKVCGVSERKGKES